MRAGLEGAGGMAAKETCVHERVSSGGGQRGLWPKRHMFLAADSAGRKIGSGSCHLCAKLTWT